jgi:hypothetical protein
MFDIATGFPRGGTDMNGPLPSGLVRGAPDGHAADVHHLEAPLFEFPHFIGLKAGS